ncbi:MAG TPA: hypothetical protein ENF75_07055 [Acidilobales archaeon]|nr:hypothetical protein [Acidilobales archaeon]
MVKINYRDTFRYLIKVKEVCLGADVKALSNVSVLYGLRLNINGCWYIKISSKPIGTDYARTLKPPKAFCGYWVEDAELFKGSVSIGKDVDIDELIMNAQELISEFPSINSLSIRAVSEYKEFMSDYVNASLTRHSYFINASIPVMGIELRLSLGVLGTYRNLIDIFRRRIEEVNEDIRSLMRGIRGLKPHELGKWLVILDSEASVPLLKFIKKFLIMSKTNLRLLRRKVFIKSIDIVDNPMNDVSINTSFFDDECVRTTKKVLVEDGEIVSLLSSRVSDVEELPEDVTPGNAYGITNSPKPDFTTMEVLPGDWSLREIIQESKRAILIKGVEWFSFSGSTIYLKPRTAWLVIDGEVKEPILVRLVRLVFPTSYLKVDCVSKEVRYVCLDRETYVLPYLRTIGGIE